MRTQDLVSEQLSHVLYSSVLYFHAAYYILVLIYRVTGSLYLLITFIQSPPSPNLWFKKKSVILEFLSKKVFFGCTAWLVGSLFPDQGSNPESQC